MPKKAAASPIIETVMEDVDSLHPYHLNPRRGNVDVVADSLHEFGQFKAIVVNRGTKTKHQREILAGNHTWRGAKKNGVKQILVHWVDVDEQTAKKIVLADNRTSDLADYDNQKLSELLVSVDDLSGVGYTPQDLDELADLLNPAAPGSADFADAPDEDNYAAQYAVTVMCSDEAHQERVFNELKAQGYNCKVVTV